MRNEAPGLIVLGRLLCYPVIQKIQQFNQNFLIKCFSNRIFWS